MPQETNKEEWKIVKSDENNFLIHIDENRLDEYTKRWVEQLKERSREEGYRAGKEEEKTCPPHNMIDYHFAGAWGGSTPPPNKKCTKCLMETNF